MVAHAIKAKMAVLEKSYNSLKEQIDVRDDFLTKRGRMPTRTDVPVNPAHVSERLKERKIIATIFAGEEQKKWQGLFKEIFKPR